MNVKTRELQLSAPQFEQLVETHREGILKLAARLGLNPEDQEDAVQDCIVKAYAASHRFDVSRPFLPWLMKVCENMMRTMRRAVWKQKFRQCDGDVILESFAAPSQHSEDRSEYVIAVQERLAKLSPQDLEIFRVCVLEERTLREATLILNIKKSTLTNRVNRICQFIRSGLEESA